MTYLLTEISLNSISINNNKIATHSVGEKLHLGIRIENSLSWPLVDIMLQLFFFQDFQNGVINQQLDSCLSTIGTTEVNLKTVNSRFYISRITNQKINY